MRGTGTGHAPHGRVVGPPNFPSDSMHTAHMGVPSPMTLPRAGRFLVQSVLARPAKTAEKPRISLRIQLRVLVGVSQSNTPRLRLSFLPVDCLKQARSDQFTCLLYIAIAGW